MTGGWCRWHCFIHISDFSRNLWDLFDPTQVDGRTWEIHRAPNGRTRAESCQQELNMIGHHFLNWDVPPQKIPKVWDIHGYSADILDITQQLVKIGYLQCLQSPSASSTSNVANVVPSTCHGALRALARWELGCGVPSSQDYIDYILLHESNCL